jgi:hypothetical protein
MYGEFKKAVMRNFKLLSQPEKKHDNLKIACVVIENRFWHVYCAGKMCDR